MAINFMRSLVAALLAIVVASLLPSAPTQAACSGLEPLATIPFGAGPREIVADSQRQRVYVANSGDATISVIDSSSASVIASWPLTGPIRTMALNPSTGSLYVAYDVGQGRTELWMLAPESGQPVRGLWFPWSIDALAVSASRHRVYLAGKWTSPNAISFERLSIVDGDIAEELRASHAEGPSGGLTWYSDVAVDEATGMVYAAHHYKYNEQSFVGGLDQDQRGRSAGIQFGDAYSSPDRIVIDSVRRRALITLFSGIRLVDIGDEPRWRSLGSDPPLTYTGVKIAARGRLAISLDDVAGVAFALPMAATGRDPAVLSGFDVVSGQEVAQTPLANSMSRRLAVDSAVHRVYVTNESAATVSVFRGFAAADTPAC